MKIPVMRGLFIGLVAVLLAQPVMSQDKQLSPDDYAKLIQSSHDILDAVDAAVSSSKFDEARESLAVLRKNFMAFRDVWSARGRSDVMRIILDGMNRLAALEELLGRPKPSVERVQQATKEFRSDVLSRLPKVSS